MKYKINERIETLEIKVNNLENESYSYVSWSGLICLILIISAVIIFVNIISSNNFNNKTMTDYCKEKYGDDYFLNIQPEMPQNVFSCDTLSENGTFIVKYFTREMFYEWKEKSK